MRFSLPTLTLALGALVSARPQLPLPDPACIGWWNRYPMCRGRPQFPFPDPACIGWWNQYPNCWGNNQPFTFPPLEPAPSKPEPEPKEVVEKRDFIDIINEIHDMYNDPAGLDNELNLRATHRLTCFSNVPEQTDQMVTSGCYYAGTVCHGPELRLKNCPANLASCWCVREMGPG